jgi:hypothetical protein
MECDGFQAAAAAEWIKCGRGKSLLCSRFRQLQLYLRGDGTCWGNQGKYCSITVKIYGIFPVTTSRTYTTCRGQRLKIIWKKLIWSNTCTLHYTSTTVFSANLFSFYGIRFTFNGTLKTATLYCYFCSQSSWCPDRHSKWGPAKYKSTKLIATSVSLLDLGPSGHFLFPSIFKMVFGFVFVHS